MRPLIIGLTALVIGVQHTAASSAAEGGALRSFAYEDSINMRYPLRTSLTGETSPAVKDVRFFDGDYGVFSPNKKYFYTVDRRGDLKNNVVIDTLNVYLTEKLVSALGRDAGEAAPAYTLERTSADNNPPIYKLKWLNNREISFLAMDENNVRQIFVTDIRRKKTKQITTHPTSILNYEMSGETLVFHARVERRTDPASMTRSRPLGDNSLIELVDPLETNNNGFDLSQIYVKTKSGAAPKRVPLPTAVSFSWLTEMEISPDGKRVLFFYPYVDPLPEFAEYPEHGNEVYYTPALEGETSQSKQLIYIYRHWTYDIETGETRPLINAPYGARASQANNHDVSIIWTGPDTAIIPGLFMPLSGVRGEERRKRASAPVVAYVDFKTGDIEPILYQPLTPVMDYLAGAKAPTIVEMRWDAETDRLLLKREPDAASPGEGAWYEAYFREGSGWGHTPASQAEFDALGDAALKHVVSIDEGLNTPPVYTFAEIDGDRKTVFRRLNPQLDQLSLAHTEQLAWTDRNGIEWKGGLVYPVDYKPGKRYPFILQTHGFNESEFIVDGPDRVPTAYAARVFSANGFFVFQLAEQKAAITLGPTEGALVTAGYESLIDQLAEEGLIDRRRVGAIGWSRTAFHVMQAAWRNPDLFASVTSNDGIQRGYMEFFSQIHRGADFMRRVMARVNGGAAPVGEGLNEWVKHAATFNADKIKAAVLVEPITPSSLIPMWETYATLKFLGKPVDLVYHPAGAHVLQNPHERYVSQKSNVQWHQFWLTGVEDPDPVFDGQYDRWRKMRDDYCAILQTEKAEPPVYCDFR